MRTWRGLTTLTRAMVPVAALTAAGLLSTGAAANPAPADSSAQAAVRGVKVYDGEHFTGPNKWLNGNVGRCYYVGTGWNDTINSARTGSNRKVELWDNSNCTGGAIVVDRTGYSEIGDWVSAYRIR